MKRIRLVFCSILLTLATTTTGWADLSDGLVAYYPFSGSANDEGSNGNHGTVIGATLTEDMFGNTNSAYYFDGINDYIRASANNLPTAERTVSLWFYTDEVNINPYNPGYRGNLVGYGGAGCGSSWLMGIDHWGIPSMGVTSHCNLKTIEYYYSQEPIGNWYNLAITTSPTGTYIYVNGELKASNSSLFFNNTYVNGRDLAIGVAVRTNGYAPYTDYNVGYFKGIIDNVRIYDRALSSSEIQELYAFEVVPVPAAVLLGVLGLGVAGWKLRKFA